MELHTKQLQIGVNSSVAAQFWAPPKMQDPIRVPRIENRVPRIREIDHRVPRIRENRIPTGP